ncbi:MAG: type 1 glutamine amidotransferase [Acidobacteriota bacterium]
MLEHERRCIAATTDLADPVLDYLNAVEGLPEPEVVTGYDAIIVGGSGDFSVVERDQPFLESTIALLQRLIDIGFPIFGCCYGFQLLVEALGGMVVRDAENAEIGSYEVKLTEAGIKDPLFGQLPEAFVAQMGHFDRAETLPNGAQNLATSSLCTYQAMRVPGKQIWATQFHPELDQRGNRDRCLAYIKEFGNIETYEALPSPEALTILPKFLELVASNDG